MTDERPMEDEGRVPMEKGDSLHRVTMSIDPLSSTHLSSPAPPAASPRPRPEQADFARTLADADKAAPAPDALPAEALEAVQVANQVYAQLRAVDRELRFEHTPHGVRINVYDGDGKLVQRVPATDVLKLSSGEQAWLA